MTPLADADQTIELREAQIADRAASGRVLAPVVQESGGGAESYSPNITASGHILLRDGTNQLRIDWTPPVNAWWLVSFRAQFQKMNAAYDYAYGIINISPAPAFGPARQAAIHTQHSAGPSRIAGRSMRILYPLAAGVPYACYVTLDLIAGTWQYYRGASYMKLHGVGFAR